MTRIILLALVALLPDAAMATPENLVPNGDFSDGLTGWHATHGREVTLPDDTTDRGVRAIRIDATGLLTPEAGVVSDPFPIEPERAYELGAFVKSLSGAGTYKVSLEWFDADGQHLGYENSWTGVLAGKDWDRHSARVVAAREARSARILAGVRRGCAALMTQFFLRPLDEPSCRVYISLMPEALRQGEPSRVRLRVDNHGPATVESLTATITLPEGVTTEEPLRFEARDIGAEGHFSTNIAITGYPRDLDAPVVCSVEAVSRGETIKARAATPLFVTVADATPQSTTALPAPEPPETTVKLGCYYFPVMLDWDRSGWGVRKVDYLEPALGYYDEASPEVADWHIYWARTHGVSFFVFDWYYNQGFCYLNDALEQGFLKSRFADQMEFCIDWCNEGHCAQFKPLDFSTKGLENFARLLTERYFAHDNYLRVDGKPVVLIHQPMRIVDAHGGWEGCRAALDAMRTVAREAGHPGIYFVAVQNNPLLADYGKGGFDCATAYAYGLCDVPRDANAAAPYEALAARHVDAYRMAREKAHAQGMDYIPSAWVGWDDYARNRYHSWRTSGNDPAAFRHNIEVLPEFAEPDTRLALYESWNEWGEGGQSEPGEPYGFGRLAAIRDAISTARGPYPVASPTPEDVRRLDNPIRMQELDDHYFRRYAHSPGLHEHGRLVMDFDSVESLWFRPGGQVRQVRIEDGALRGESVGEDPILQGPPIMDLPAESIAGIRLVMQVDHGSFGQIFWTSDEQPETDEARTVRFDLVADGRPHEYRLELASHPAWAGTIRQFRFDPMDGPGQFALHHFETFGPR